MVDGGKTREGVTDSIKTVAMNIEQEIQNILDRNFTRGDNANALKELLVLYNVVGQGEQLVCDCPIPNTTMELPHRCVKCNKPIKWDS